MSFNDRLEFFLVTRIYVDFTIRRLQRNIYKTKRDDPVDCSSMVKRHLANASLPFRPLPTAMLTNGFDFQRAASY